MHEGGAIEVADTQSDAAAHGVADAAAVVETVLVHTLILGNNNNNFVLLDLKRVGARAEMSSSRSSWIEIRQKFKSFYEQQIIYVYFTRVIFFKLLIEFMKINRIFANILVHFKSKLL